MQKKEKLRLHHSVLAQIKQLLLVATDFLLSCFPLLESVSVGSQVSAGVSQHTQVFCSLMDFKCSLQ